VVSTIDPARGAAFGDDDVARCYLKRPPYPPKLYEFLQDTPRRHRRALDPGCGPGKISLELAPYFDHVDAIDPSAPMLALGRALDGGRNRNINWIEVTAESAKLNGPYDLVTAGASIHWIRHEVLFPKLAAAIARNGLIAVLDGDDAFDPPWAGAWKAFMIRWLALVKSGTYDERAFDSELQAFDRWMDVAGRRHFIFSFEQSIDDFITCQHSRATWARSAMGATAAAAFDRELRELLLPHARAGVLEYRVRTRVAWGTPRTSPHAT
jgi:SAM-dependent methyltransferase